MASKPILPVAANIIYEARIRCGINQSELADRLGVVPSAVSDWEAGKKDPSVSNLYRIVAACGQELRFHAVIPTEQDIQQAATDYRELANGNARISVKKVAGLVKKYNLGMIRRAP